MTWAVTGEERSYLRKLAGKQAEYAALPVMNTRRDMWYALNDGVAGARPPFIIETWTFDRDFMPEGILQCTSEAARGIEVFLLRNIRNHELIDDDKVIPDFFPISAFMDIDQLGVQIDCERVKDAQGIETGYKFIHPFKDLKRDLHRIQKPVHSVDREKTAAWQGFLEDLIGDILPIRLQTGIMANPYLTGQIITLMGMEAFFTAMYDTPDELHQLMRMLTDNALEVMKWGEAEGLLCLNNGNQESFGSSYNFTTRLPAPGYEGGPARLKDMWGCSNSQETVGVSPGMFNEFCFPYLKEVCEPMGLLYFGCCEPAHPFWADISRLPHLKKISISRWCDQRFMADALKGTDIVFSRKPDPGFLGIDKILKEEAWAEHIRETLDLTRDGVAVEFIVRDVYTVSGNLNNPRKAVEIARREIDRLY